MITLKDYENLINYFEENEIPENLKNFMDKLRVMYDSIVYKEEVQKKIKEFDSKLMELSEKDKEEE